MATPIITSPQQLTDTYARIASLVQNSAPGGESLIDRLHDELLTWESRAYAAGWTDALSAIRRTRTRP